MSDEDPLDSDPILRLMVEQMKRNPPSEAVRLNFSGSVNAMVWLHVLAIPHVFRSMRRKPSPEHLVNMVDIYLAYVRRGERRTPPKFQPVPYERREPAALRLRALLEAWTPPDLPEEITAAVRDVLHAEGSTPAEGWDHVPYEPEPPIEDQLWWPEDVPEALRPPPPPESRS